MDVLSMFVGAIAFLALAHIFLRHPAWGHSFNTLLKIGSVGYLLILGGLQYLGHGTLPGAARPLLFWIGVTLAIAQTIHISLSFETKKPIRRRTR